MGVVLPGRFRRYAIASPSPLGVPPCDRRSPSCRLARHASKSFVATPASLTSLKSVNDCWDRIEAATLLPGRAKRAAELGRPSKQLEKTTEAEVYAASYQGFRLSTPSEAGDDTCVRPPLAK